MTATRGSSQLPGQSQSSSRPRPERAPSIPEAHRHAVRAPGQPRSATCACRCRRPNCPFARKRTQISSPDGRGRIERIAPSIRPEPRASGNRTGTCESGRMTDWRPQAGRSRPAPIPAAGFSRPGSASAARTAAKRKTRSPEAVSNILNSLFKKSVLKFCSLVGFRMSARAFPEVSAGSSSPADSVQDTKNGRK